MVCVSQTWRSALIAGVEAGVGVVVDPTVEVAVTKVLTMIIEAVALGDIIEAAVPDHDQERLAVLVEVRTGTIVRLMVELVTTIAAAGEAATHPLTVTVSRLPAFLLTSL